MRFAAVLAVSLLCVSSALGQSAPASSSQAASVATDVPPAHPITPEQVHEILELTSAHRLMVQVMNSTFASLEKTFPPYMPKDAIDDLRNSLDNLNIEPYAVASFQRHLSVEDGAGIIAFYKTPAGRHYVSSQSQIARDLQDAGAKEATQIIQTVIQRHLDEIKSARDQYLQNHPDKPTVITPN